MPRSNSSGLSIDLFFGIQSHRMFNLDEDGHDISSDSSFVAAKKGDLTQWSDTATTNSGQSCPGVNLDVEVFSSSRASAQVESKPRRVIAAR